MKKIYIVTALIVSAIFATTNITYAQVSKQEIEKRAREAAEKKLEAERQAEAQRKAKKEAEEREREAKWKAREAEMEAERKIEWEKKKAEEEQEKYEKSDKGSIEKILKERFGEWNKKGEFEKQSDYDERLKTQSRAAFIDASTEIPNFHALSSYNESINVYVGVRDRDEEMSYDPDKEELLISVWYKEKKFATKLKMSVEEAQDFIQKCREDFLRRRESSQREKELRRINWTVNTQDWYFVENEMFPGKIVGDGKYIIDLPLENPTKIAFNFDNLGIDNPYLKGFVLDRSEIIEACAVKSNLKGLNDAYKKDKELFANKDEFETFYKKGRDSYLSEVKKRTTLKYLTINSQLVGAMNFQEVGRQFADGKYNLPSVVLSRGYFNSLGMLWNDEIVNVIFYIINDNKNELHYLQIIDFVVGNNKILNKEWAENKKFFETKTEFYDAYVSADYKNILKANKEK